VPVPYLQVANARRALAQSAHCFYDFPCRKLKLIGITGTNGKTTTAFLLRYLLNACGAATAMFGTIEYDTLARKIAAPLTTPAAPDFVGYIHEAAAHGAAYAVAEISSHALALERVTGCDFAAAVFTNLTRDHLDYHGTWENYAAAKQKLFTALPSSACAIINADDPAGEFMTQHCAAPRQSYGSENPHTAWNATAMRYTLSGTSFILRHYDGAVGAVASPLCGAHNVANVLAATVTLVALGFAPEKIMAAVQNFPGVPGRLERLRKNGREVFIDYAHTPDALAQALATLRPLTPGKLWVGFGCGGDRDRGKRPLMAQVAAAGADAMVVTDDNPRTEASAAIIADIRAGFPATAAPQFIPARAAAIKFALANSAPQDAILIAGKGHEDYQIMGTEKIHFSDRETVLHA
jgi:UDP-N-acetylmuramoyl-L-alanyl-D-glutamate--2,6-diaminopimelate ligase